MDHNEKVEICEVIDVYKKYGDATIRTKYQIRTRDGFGPNTNSAQNFNYL